ncbi:MAG: hypothetical protein U0168_19800 [Nannocystaceae bacterium]
MAPLACGGDDARGEGTATSAGSLGTLTTTGGGSSGSSSGGGDTSGAGETASGSGSGGEGPSFDLGDADTTAGACVPTAEVESACDGVDDDCNGFVDDIDVAGDGICDCLEIALLGAPGSLTSSMFVQWLGMQGTSTERIDPALVDDATLAAYDIIIIDQLTRDYAAAEVTAFADWVDGGGGLMAMTGHTADPAVAQTRPNAILASFDVAYSGALLDGPVTDFLPHPISNGLSSVTFTGGFAVTELQVGATDVVAQLPGTPVARARSFGDGKVFAWGDEWIEYDSEWSTMPEITQLWVNALGWLRPSDLCAPPPG